MTRTLPLALAIAIAGCDPDPMRIDGGAPPNDGGGPIDDGGPRADTGPPDDGGTPGDGGCPTRTLDLLAVMADPLGPARLLGGGASLSSSREPEPQEGLRNNDHTRFLDVPPGGAGRAVLADERGPGAMTRMWFTLGGLGGAMDDALGRSTRIHVIVDGRDIELVEGERGATLDTLTSGALSDLPEPWVLDPETTSGGFVIAVPIHYQESLRVEMEVPEGAGLLIYYQIDVRSFPTCTRVEPYTGALDVVHLTMLEAATALWDRHEHPGVPDPMPARDLAPGAALEHRITGGPGVITTIDVDAPPSAHPELDVSIEIDGAHAIDLAGATAAPLSMLTGSAPPMRMTAAEAAYSGAFTSADATHARLHAPIPFEGEAIVRIVNTGGATVSVGSSVLVERLPLPDDVGRFRAQCVVAAIDNEYTIEDPNNATETIATHPNVVLARMTGHGQYAGHTFALWAPGAWWLGLENDHEVFVDGAWPILGTGTEDYYGGAFYFKHGPFDAPTAGATFFWTEGAGRHREAGYDTRLYRHHVADPIPFEREFRFEVESYLDEARWTGCTYFYMAP